MIMHAALLVTAAITLAHSWYPQECCSDQDCAIIDSKRVVVQPGAYVVDGGEWVIPADKARVSPDEHYHGCVNKRMIAPRQMICFFAPRGSV